MISKLDYLGKWAWDLQILIGMLCMLNPWDLTNVAFLCHVRAQDEFHQLEQVVIVTSNWLSFNLSYFCFHFFPLLQYTLPQAFVYKVRLICTIRKTKDWNLLSALCEGCVDLDWGLAGEAQAWPGEVMLAWKGSNQKEVMIISITADVCVNS